MLRNLHSPLVHAPDAMPRVVTALVAGFALAQGLLVCTIANGPSGDEGIYAWLGMVNHATWPRVEGGDWVNGSPVLWPSIVGPLWRFGGLTAVRLATVALMTLTLMLLARASARWSGGPAATVTTLLLVTNGPLLALGHLAVYDVPAITALAVSVYAAAHRTTGGDRRWVLVAGVALGVAVVTKYALVFVAPLVVLTFAMNRPVWASRRVRVVDAVVTAAAAAGVVIAHNAWILGRVIPPSYWAYTAAAPPVGRWLVTGEQLFFALPVLLLVWGLWPTPPGRAHAGALPRALLVLGGAVLVYPLFHLLTGNPQSANKHVVIGLVAAAPALGALWRDALARRGMVALGAWGALQWAILEYSWVNARGVADQLAAQVRAGDVVLGNEGTFRYRAALYARGVDGGLRDLALDVPRARDVRTWLVLESPVSNAEQRWLESADAARAQRVGRWIGWHIGADARRPFGVHRVETQLYRWEAATPELTRPAGAAPGGAAVPRPTPAPRGP